MRTVIFNVGQPLSEIGKLSLIVFVLSSKQILYMPDKDEPTQPAKPVQPQIQPEPAPKTFPTFPSIDTRERIEKSEPPGKWSDKELWPNE